VIVEEVAELLKLAGFRPVGLVDDHQLGPALGVQLGMELGVVSGVAGAFDVDTHAVHAEIDLEQKLPGGDRDVRGEHRGSTDNNSSFCYSNAKY